MTDYQFTKTPVSVSGLTREISASSFSTKFLSVTKCGTDLTVTTSSDLSADEQAELSAIVAAHTGFDAVAYTEALVDSATTFAFKLILQFAAENIRLGITQDGMTGTVLSKLQNVLLCLLTGSLYEAITRVKAIPETDYDPKYLTPARLLAFVNKIETFLGAPLSTEL